MILTVTSDTDIGLVRKNNEDTGLVQSEIVCDSSVQGIFNTSSESPVIAAIADGMGGCDDGEVASLFVIERLREFRESLSDAADAISIVNDLDVWTRRVNTDIRTLGSMELKRMGSTLIGMVFTKNAVVSFNAGDSRLYRFRDGWLRQESTDHSMRNRMNDLSIASNLIYNCFGAVKNTFIECKDITPTIKNGDIYMLCSDGLSDMLSDESIEDLLKEDASPQTLIEAAKEAGGKDNITVCLVRVQIDIEK